MLDIIQRSLVVVLSGFLLLCSLSIGVSPTAAVTGLNEFTAGLRAPQGAPPTATSCPAPGTAHGALLPVLAGSHQQSIVFSSSEEPVNSAPATAKPLRYGVTSGRTTLIAAFPRTFLNEAQLSANGQWILFTTQTASRRSQLQVIRLDGLYLQTLFCQSAPGGISSVQWSPNQQLIIFLNQTSQNGNKVSLLHLNTGKLETVVSLPPQTFLTPRVWLDTTRVYLEDHSQPAPPTTLYLLNTGRGAQQQGTLLAVVNDPQHSFASYDSSADATRLYIARCRCEDPGNKQGPSLITVQKATGGGTPQIICQSARDAITTVRAISSSTLLLVIENSSPTGQGASTHNGLWKLSLSSGKLARLASAGSHQQPLLNVFTQYQGSNISRDGRLYALELSSTLKPPQFTLLYGALSGGALTPFASVSGGSQAYMVGWTTG